VCFVVYYVINPLAPGFAGPQMRGRISNGGRPVGINTNGCSWEKDLREAAMMYFCEYCGYTAKESEFLEGECPACCTDLWTGKVNPKSIPKVFHQKQEETHEKD
jgi:hypothetical protein